MLKRRGVDLNMQTESCSQEKLSRLMTGAFNELVCDICDEIRRRELRDPLVNSLPPEEKYVDKRNQARKKLATLSDRRFEELSCEVLRELDQRAMGLRQGPKKQPQNIPLGTRAAPGKIPLPSQLNAKPSTYTGPGPTAASADPIKQQPHYRDRGNPSLPATSSVPYPTAATYAPDSSSRPDLDYKQRNFDVETKSLQSVQGASDDTQRNAIAQQAVQRTNLPRNDEIGSDGGRQIKENIILLQMDVKEVKRENQKLRSILKELSIKLNEKDDEVSRISKQLMELKTENVQSRRIISNLEVKLGKNPPPVAPTRDTSESFANKRRSLSNSTENKTTLPSSQKAPPSKSQFSHSLAKETKSQSQPTENGEIIKVFVDISNALLEATKSMDSAEMLSSMKNFILRLKEITNESSQYKEFCDSADQLDELHACQEYVMVSSGNLVEIVKELSISSEPSEAQDLSELESALEVTKNSVYLLAKLIRQLLSRLYRSKTQTKMSKSKIVSAFNRWVVSGQSLSHSSDLISSMFIFLYCCFLAFRTCILTVREMFYPLQASSPIPLR